MTFAPLTKFSPQGVMTLEVTTDLHDGSSCGAPDCYGTTIRISMTPVRPGSCTYRNATVLTEDYDGCHYKFDHLPTGKQEETFAADTAFDTRNSKLSELRLFNKSKKRAILVTPWGTLYFGHLPPKFTLHKELEPEFGGNKCCYGAGMSPYRLDTADEVQGPQPSQKASQSKARHARRHHGKPHHGKAHHKRSRHRKARHHRQWSSASDIRTAFESVFGTFSPPEICLP